MYIDLLTRIKNAQVAGKSIVKAPYSKMDREVAKLLADEGFVGNVKVQGRGTKKVLSIKLDKEGGGVSGLEFLSKPGRRRYKGYRDLRRVKGGHGILAVSTPKGVLSGKEARKRKVGGQILFKLW